MAMAIHPTAIIEDRARLGAGVEIGPFCLVGPRVRLGDGVRLVSHVSITGETELGAGFRAMTSMPCARRSARFSMARMARWPTAPRP